jgi:hypothetical protein
MPQTRRELLAFLMGLAAARKIEAAGQKLGIPGPFPGRVIEVHHPGSLVSGAYQPAAIKGMMHKGITELTGAPGWADAWRVFFEPGDVVAIKQSPVAGRGLCSDASVLNLIIDGLKQAGVATRDIVVYERYRRELFGARYHQWLPEGVRFSWAAEHYETWQLGMNGYDRDVFVDLPIVKPGDDPDDPHVRKSHVALCITKQVNKVINVPTLKHHQSAGVTLALKNMSHGMVNNVNRSHIDRNLNACGIFIPAVVDLPVIRQKVVLHILDGVKAGYNGGPGTPARYRYEYHTMYFATDPVALDKTGWRAIEEKRKSIGLPPVNQVFRDDPDNYYNGQVEHIEMASRLGLGVFDDDKIKLQRFSLV